MIMPPLVGGAGGALRVFTPAATRRTQRPVVAASKRTRTCWVLTFCTAP
jgi:hypothetical protein